MQTNLNSNKVIKHFTLSEDAFLSYFNVDGSAENDFVLTMTEKLYMFDIHNFDNLLVDDGTTIVHYDKDNFNKVTLDINKGLVVCLRDSIKSDRHIYSQYIKKFRKFFVLKFENVKIVFYRKSYTDQPIDVQCGFAYKNDINNAMNVFSANIYFPREYNAISNYDE